jgi:hypothetical protein
MCSNAYEKYFGLIWIEAKNRTPVACYVDTVISRELTLEAMETEKRMARCI